MEKDNIYREYGQEIGIGYEGHEPNFDNNPEFARTTPLDLKKLGELFSE